MDIIELAGCVILDEYGRVLLLHRDLGDSGQWELPGGKIEESEEPAGAAARELAEELAVEVEIIAALGSELFEEYEQPYRFHWFEARLLAGQPTVMEPETFDDFDYYELEDFPSLALSANLLVLYPKIMSGDVALKG